LRFCRVHDSKSKELAIGRQRGKHIQGIRRAAWVDLGLVAGNGILSRRLRRVPGKLHRDRTDKVITVQLEQKPGCVKDGSGAVVIERRDPHGELRHFEKIGVSHHLVEHHGISEVQF